LNSKVLINISVGINCLFWKLSIYAFQRLITVLYLPVYKVWIFPNTSSEKWRGHCLKIAHKVKFIGIFLKIEGHLYAELSYVQVNTVVSDTKKSFAFKNTGL